MLTYQDFMEHVPPNTIEFVGQNQLKLNFNQLTGKELNPNEALIEGTAKFMQALVALTDAINEDRAKADPPLPPITFASRELEGSIEQPIFRYTVDLQVNASAFMDNLLDPTS